MPIAAPLYDKQCSGMGPGELYSLSQTVDDAVKTLDPNAEGWVEGLMQDCLDNTVLTRTIVFGMWFYIDKPTPNKDFKFFGTWIIDVMNLLDTIPRVDHAVNAQPTLVYFRFYAPSELLDVTVSIQEYWAKTGGKSGEEVFRMFYAEP
jgi:hypothetical protein